MLRSAKRNPLVRPKSSRIGVTRRMRWSRRHRSPRDERDRCRDLDGEVQDGGNGTQWRPEHAHRLAGTFVMGVDLAEMALLGSTSRRPKGVHLVLTSARTGPAASNPRREPAPDCHRGEALDCYPRGCHVGGVVAFIPCALVLRVFGARRRRPRQGRSRSLRESRESGRSRWARTQPNLRGRVRIARWRAPALHALHPVDAAQREGTDLLSGACGPATVLSPDGARAATRRHRLRCCRGR